MPVTVTANGRTVVHRGSDGQATGFPDVCKTPQPNVPIPYVNVALARDAAGTCTTVFCDGFPVMKASSYLAKSYGDEPGVGGGIISGHNRGKASFFTFSHDVRVEGEGAPRHLDWMYGNHGSPPNVFQQFLDLLRELGIKEGLCIVFCQCNAAGLKMACFRPFFADPLDMWWIPIGAVNKWDPLVPGVWLEVPYDTRKNPPEMIESDVDSRHQTGKDKQPLKVPERTITAMRGTPKGAIVVPDVVVARDPHVPPRTEKDIEKIYEIKFDGDKTGPALDEQVEAQQRICANVEVLNAVTCGCAARKAEEDAREAAWAGFEALAHELAPYYGKAVAYESGEGHDGYEWTMMDDGQWHWVPVRRRFPATPGIAPAPAPTPAPEPVVPVIPQPVSPSPPGFPARPPLPESPPELPAWDPFPSPVPV